jgi:hypothetical protein
VGLRWSGKGHGRGQSGSGSGSPKQSGMVNTKP